MCLFGPVRHRRVIVRSNAPAYKREHFLVCGNAHAPLWNTHSVHRTVIRKVIRTILTLSSSADLVQPISRTVMVVLG